MRTDPRKACANEDERLLWALIHDGIAHPLMALTLFSKWSVWFHDWTSQKAWPETRKSRVRGAVHLFFDAAQAESYTSSLKAEDVPHVVRAIPTVLGYRYEVERLFL